MTEASSDQAAAAANGPQIGLQRVFLKDASFEAPNSPGILRGEWKPAVTMNLSTRTEDLGESRIEAAQNSQAYGQPRWVCTVKRG